MFSSSFTFKGVILVSGGCILLSCCFFLCTGFSFLRSSFLLIVLMLRYCIKIRIKVYNLCIFVYFFHKSLPYNSSTSASILTVNSLWHIIATPYCCSIIMTIAYKPYILCIISGSCLACTYSIAYIIFSSCTIG